jgi:hypothetical protein
MSEIQLHAEDSMGKAANDAALLASGLDVLLLLAASRRVDRKARVTNLERAFVQWQALCRAMSRLEQAAPNAFRQAHTEDANINDFRERNT